MKIFVVLSVLLTLVLMQTKAKWIGLKPMEIVMPINPKLTPEHSNNINAANVQSSKQFPALKDTNVQPGMPMAFAIFFSEEHVSNIAEYIVNGRPPIPGQFPFMAALIIDGASLCAGSIISNTWILTAAHCSGRSYRVIVGATRFNNPESGSATQTSTNSIQHSQYNPITINNDIRLIRLPSALSFTTNVSPTRLPCNPGSAYVGETGHIVYWGVGSILQYVNVTVISNSDCGIINSSKLCAQASGATCIDGSGSPIVIRGNDARYTQIGIMSLSTIRCQYPYVFTRVSSYIDWIRSNTGIDPCL